MTERRQRNSELRLQRLSAEEKDAAERGILELFEEVDAEPSDEDAALARDPDENER